jgi:hypothetical protein
MFFGEVAENFSKPLFTGSIPIAASKVFRQLYFRERSMRFQAAPETEVEERQSLRNAQRAVHQRLLRWKPY